MNTPVVPSPINRVFVIVLDSAGVGFLPDAGEYGDNGGDLGANTLGHIGDAVGLGEHLSGRAAATIAVTKRQQGSACPALVGESAGRPSEINRG